MPVISGGGPGERRETPRERDDRNFAELLQELRVTQTGVQILFAFLLTLAFTPRFRELDDPQRATYIVTLLLAVTATVLFITPTALHRGLFRRGVKRTIVEISSLLANLGLAALALAFTGSLLLVVDVVVGPVAGIAAAAGALVLCCGLWGVLPRVLRRRVPPPARYAGTSDPWRSPRPGRRPDGPRNGSA